MEEVSVVGRISAAPSDVKAACTEIYKGVYPGSRHLSDDGLAGLIRPTVHSPFSFNQYSGLKYSLFL